MSQITLNLNISEVHLPDNFLKSECNNEAYSYIVGFPRLWGGSNCLLIVGEEYSGKTHLAKIWQNISGAKFIEKSQFSEVLKSDAVSNFIIENIERLQQVDEEGLFHIYNNCKAAGKYLLLTSKKPVYELSFTLPDLKSRISSSLITQVNPPSEAFQQQLFHKHFLDMQINVPVRVIDYLTPRIQRSFKATYEIANILNKKSVETKRPISIPFVKEILEI